MSGSIYGNLFKVSTWGESHGKAIGATVDGCPAGIPICEDDIQKVLDRRKPGQSKFATKRNEADKVQILSGVFEGKTTGTPISMIIFNEDQKSKDYSNIQNAYRPSHADYGFDVKYGFRDYRGGGRSSGRETASRVAAGAIALKILNQLNIEFLTYTIAVGKVKINRSHFNEAEIFNNLLFMPDAKAAVEATAYLEQCMENGDSSGAVVECVIKGVKPGIGEPAFDKLDAAIAKGIFSIGAVKGLEFGSGFHAGESTGSQNNDSFYYDENKRIKKYTNNSGGIIGGITDGDDIVFRVAFKPTPSISIQQKTINNSYENIDLNVKGRHDPIIAIRGLVVVETMAALTLVDYILQATVSRIDTLKKIYNQQGVL